MAHHGSPQIPISQRCALLVPVFEGEHHQNEVATNPVQVPLDLHTAQNMMDNANLLSYSCLHRQLQCILP